MVFLKASLQMYHEIANVKDYFKNCQFLLQCTINRVTASKKTII